MDIFFVAAGPRYVRRRPGTTAVTAYPPALLLAASRASSITSASMSSMCPPISRAVAARSRPIVGAAAAASGIAPIFYRSRDDPAAAKPSNTIPAAGITSKAAVRRNSGANRSDAGSARTRRRATAELR
jgi:hypothetical protein